MSENRTSKVFRTSFKNASGKASNGYYGQNIQLPRKTEDNIIYKEEKIRKEIHQTIIKMVQKHNSIEEIENTLNSEAYQNYQQYFQMWIGDWAVKLNPNIKSIITKGIFANKTEEEMLKEIEEANNQVYQIYKEAIQRKVRREIEIKKEKEEKAKQEKEEER